MLRRLEVRGFKSFATTTVLDMGPGINVIVGPNGSGKSNLAEALVWAMGEQRASRLRAGGMGEVVFSGGEGRQPAGLAEVSMTLARGEAVHADAPAETQVTRRVTRAGDANYRLNGVGCRLLDVHESLATQGLGPDALAVIRQGQVEAVCAARPPELRAVIEEAAGVALQKRRRKRAESKLARVADRLDRARDLVTELTARAVTLERQARSAHRATELEAEIESVRVRLTAASAMAASRALAIARDRQAVASQAARAAEQGLEGARAAVEAADASVATAQAGRDGAQDLARTLRSAADRLSGRAELAAERIDQARRTMERGQREREAAMAAREQGEEAARRAGLRVGRAEVAVDEADAAAADARAQREALAATAQAARSAAAESRQRADDARRAAGAARSRIERADRAVATAMERLQRLGGDAALPDLARRERRAEVAGGRVQRWGVRADDATRVVDDAVAARAAGDAARREAAGALAATGGADRSVEGTLGFGLRVRAGAERAVGAALGSLTDAVIGDDLTAALRAVREGATAAVLPAPGRDAPVAPARARPLGELIEDASPRAMAHLRRLLSDAWLVDDLSQVPAGHPGVFVTPDGAVLRPAEGVVNQSASEWVRGALHAAAKERLTAAEAVCARLAGAEGEARAVLAVVESRRRAARRCADRADAALNAGRAAAGRAAAELADAGAARDAAQQERDDAHAAAPALELELTRADAAATEAAELAARTGEAVAQSTRRLQEVDAAAAAARAELAAARVGDAEAVERLTAIQRRAASARHIVDLSLPARALQAIMDAAEGAGARARQAAGLVQSTGDALVQTQRQRAEVRQALLAAESAMESARTAAHDAEVRVAAAEARAQELGPPPEGDPGEVDPEVEARRLTELENRRRNMGAVNPLAADEHAEVTERIAEIQEQVTDLEATAHALAGHMQGLDGIVTDGFDELFAAVRERFAENIGTLFPGGRGRLVEVVGDDGEAGIEVQVVPAGKRARPLAMLSGGERSLVALAFCMAIAMTRPAPFYLLDEVEAALDDSNLRRFLALVRKLSDQTQFLLITHQQPTVEIADTLFGVTMGRDGVSQVVSRRLDHAMEGSARPFVRRQLTAIRGGRA